MRWKQRQEKAREQTELINFLFVVPLTWRMKSGINEPILVLLLFLLFSMYVCHQLFQTHLQVNWCVDTHVLPNSWVCVDVYFSWASNHHFLFILTLLTITERDHWTTMIQCTHLLTKYILYINWSVYCIQYSRLSIKLCFKIFIFYLLSIVQPTFLASMLNVRC